MELYQKIYTARDPKASLLLIHGLHEHCERYTAFGELMSTNGINVYTFDLRGHGKSEGERHFISTIREYVDDTYQIFKQIPKDKPIILLGHSMGGLIAVHFLLTHPSEKLHGVILSGAALKPGKDITPLKAKLVRFIGGIFPKLKTVPVKPELISRDLTEVDKYKNDPLIPLHGARAGLGVALLDAMNDQKGRYAQITLPALIMHGSADQLTDPEGSRIFYAQIGSLDKTIQIWEGCYHEIFNEANREEILNYTLQWILERV